MHSCIINECTLRLRRSAYYVYRSARCCTPSLAVFAPDRLCNVVTGNARYASLVVGDVYRRWHPGRVAHLLRVSRRRRDDDDLQCPRRDTAGVARRYSQLLVSISLARQYRAASGSEGGHLPPPSAHSQAL